MKISFIVILFLLQPGCSIGTHQYQSAYYQLSTEKLFANVVDDAIFAITEYNFRLVGDLHIGKGIRDRNNPEFRDYEVLLYCNLTLAQRMLELDPNMINLCPGHITVYQKDKKVIVTAHLWPVNMRHKELRSQMHSMNLLVRKIVDYATSDQPIATTLLNEDK